MGNACFHTVVKDEGSKFRKLFLSEIVFFISICKAIFFQHPVASGALILILGFGIQNGVSLS